MDTLTSFAVIALAGLIHASFQLSVSVLTMLSGHVIGTKRSNAKVWRLTTSFLLGSVIMTILLISFVALVVTKFSNGGVPQVVWAGDCGLMVGVAVAVFLFYYKRGQGTELWLPRPLAEYLADRTKATKISGEAFGLGLTGVIGELLFIIAPLSVASLALVNLSPVWQLAGITLYALISSMSLGAVWALIGGGHSLSKIQKWRESNKYFLQFCAGTGLIVLAMFVYVNQIVGVGVK